MDTSRNPAPEGYADRVRRALRTRCVHLKTKAAFLGMPPRDAVENPFDTAVWWCQRTCESMGPDGSTAAPATCDAPLSRDATPRSCYEAPPRLG